MLRRLGHEPLTQELLRAIYGALRDDPTAHAGTVRWRVAHALGPYPSDLNIQTLLEIAQFDSFGWAKYGAVRSLVEMAVVSPRDVRIRILGELDGRLEFLVGEPLTQLAWASRNDAAPVDWSDDILPLIRKAATLVRTEKDREAWKSREAAFIDWALRRQSGT